MTAEQPVLVVLTNACREGGGGASIDALNELYIRSSG